MKKRILSVLVILALLAGFGGASAMEADGSRVVIGADLTDEQCQSVYEYFGVTRDSVRELTVTNAEERQYLEGLVSSDKIGTRSISCVYIELLPEGSGLQVATENITWCSREMYVNALATAGIEDAKVIVTAPWAVSGTAALTGIFKAYEDLSGEKLDDVAKILGTQELVITAELADEIGKYDAVEIVNALKELLDETRTMTDDEIRAEIRKIAEEYGVAVEDAQVEKLLSLCRSFEKMSVEELKEKVQSAQETIGRIAQAQEKFSDFVQTVKNVFHAVIEFLVNLFRKEQ